MKLINQYEKALDKFRSEQTKPFEDRAKQLLTELRKTESRLTGFTMGMGAWWFEGMRDVKVGEFTAWDVLGFGSFNCLDSDVVISQYGKKFFKMYKEFTEICDFVVDCQNHLDNFETID